jgi:hypothetical protein
MFGNPETTSGGQALKYYSSMRLDIRAKEKIMEAGKADPVGNRVKVKVVKNKVGWVEGVGERGWVGRRPGGLSLGSPEQDAYAVCFTALFSDALVQ